MSKEKKVKEVDSVKEAPKVVERVFVVRPRTNLQGERTFLLKGRKIVNGRELNELHSSDGQIFLSDDEQLKAEMEEVK